MHLLASSIASFFTPNLLFAALDLHLLVVILEVAFGLGMVIFVHELGHFLVAKWCGVKCEKFYLGFDIYGLKLAKVQWGETEYGIGVLPLGGYVKMLGQDDNPTKAAEERERSKLANSDPASAAATTTAGDGAALDPRSYMAKSVPQRMAIISAGVIMNVIFACLMAAVAFMIGVRDLACGVSEVLPGEAAWKANIQPGDMFVQINNSGDRPLRFKDLMNAVALGDLKNGVDFQIQREGVKEPFWVNVTPDPDKKRLRPTIGVVQPRVAQLRSAPPIVIAGTPAAKANEFQPGDTIVAVGGAPVVTYLDLITQLTRHPGETLRIDVERATKKEIAKGETAPTEVVSIEVPARPMRTLGLAMEMGPITAVQAKSPADEADLKPGDLLVAVDGQAISDPLRLPELLRRRGGQTVTLTIAREKTGGQRETLEKQLALREPRWEEESAAPGSPVSVPAAGLTFSVGNRVASVDPEGPADKATFSTGAKAAAAGWSVGDEIVSAEFVLPKKPGAEEKSKDKDQDAIEARVTQAPEALKFGPEQVNWAYFNNQLQWMPDGAQVKLTLKDGRTATIEPRDASDWFNPDRGLMNASMYVTTRATSLAEAIPLALQETKDSVMQVYGVLRRVGTQISPYAFGGPITIARAAGAEASEGLSPFLIFLTLLSANLAVINFLPIPLLDGGHMVFLILEGLLRRPVNERVVVAFHYLGFVFIISLMLFVLGLDLGIVPRPH